MIREHRGDMENGTSKTENVEGQINGQRKSCRDCYGESQTRNRARWKALSKKECGMVII